MNKYFTGGGSGPVPIGQNNGVVYAYWFTDATYTVPITVAQGLPTTGDVVFWTGMGDITGGVAHWTGVTIADGQTINVTSTDSSSLTLDAASTVGQTGASPVIFTDTTLDGITSFSGAANWIGNVSIQNFYNATLATGWKVNNGAASTGPSVGQLIIQGTFNQILIQAPAAGQVRTFGSVTLTTITANTSILNISAAASSGSPWTLMGGFNLPNVAFICIFPGGSSFILNSATVQYYHAKLGHTPATSAILTTDNLFGVAGTVVLPAASQVQSGVPFGPGGGTTGTLSSAPVGIVVGG